MGGKKWVKEEDDILVKNYGIIPGREILKLLPHRHLTTITRRAAQLNLHATPGLHKRKYTSNNHYFDVPNVENSYWAGYIAADGCINVKNGGIELCCTESDIELLQRFKFDSGSTNPIKIEKGRPILGFKEESRNKYFTKDYATLKIWGKYCWQKNLDNIWNITKHKSLTLQAPNLTNINHILAYIIGYFDGDGWISYNDKFYIGWCGTPMIICWIREQIKRLLPYLSWKDTVQIKQNNLAFIIYTNKKGKAIYNLLKDFNLAFRLNRKWKYDLW